jgi:hypothetical protein
MLHTMKIAAIAAFAVLAVMAPARAADTATPDDTARFLAGMQPSADSPLAPLTKDPAWQRHARAFDAAFGRIEQYQIPKIRAWADANLAAPRPTMFYMFSGPDFLYADAFYSKATTYVLSALEPSGPVPDILKLRRGGVGPVLSYVEHSLGSILRLSFFITKQMKVDLRTGEVSGTLPVLYVFMARSGKTIHSVELITLDDNGVVHLAGEDAGKNPTRGARIKFSGSDNQEKTLYFFSTDLSNSGVKNSGFLKFCATLAPGNSLIKSASYLLHSGGFSTVRDFLLANSATIIQDDSGIPLGDYDPKQFRFFPFGRYAGPIAVFPGRYQPKYAQLFKRSQPLDFGIGYRYRANESNLLLSVRLAPGETANVETTSATPVAEAAEPKPRVRHRAKRPRRARVVAQPRGWFAQ